MNDKKSFMQGGDHGMLMLFIVPKCLFHLLNGNDGIVIRHLKPNNTMGTLPLGLWIEGTNSFLLFRGIN